MSYYDSNRSRPYPVLESNTTSLELRQQPQQALVTAENKEKTRKAIDPPPIVQVKVREPPSIEKGTWLVNPFLFMSVHLVEPEPVNGVFRPIAGNLLLGSTVSSLHRLKDINNQDGGFFVFGDISCRRVGAFRLQFSLFDLAKHNILGDHAVYVTSQVSDVFNVVTSKEFRGQMESTHLSRAFSDQGVRLRLRKEQRTITGTKRGYGDSPDPSTTSSISYSVQPGTLQDRSYGYNASKRQRSDSDYSMQMYNPSHIAPSSSMYQYPVQPYTTQAPQGPPMSQSESYGGLMSHSQTPTASGAYPYYGSLNAGVTIAPREYTTPTYTQPHPQPQQYAARRPDPSTCFEYQVPSSLAEPATTPQQQYQTYAAPSSNMHQYGYRTPLQPTTSSVTPTQPQQPKSATPYEQQYFATEPELFPQSAHTTPLPVAPPLDQGVLNRGFVPSFTGQPHDTTGDPPFKDHPYPTPH